jgi:hypothetical protein
MIKKADIRVADGVMVGSFLLRGWVASVPDHGKYPGLVVVGQGRNMARNPPMARWAVQQGLN